jgi:flagellin
VTTLLNRAITLATESATGTVTDSQRSALDAEFTSIKSEIDSIGQNTTFNGSSVFTNSATSIFISDGATSSTIAVTVGTLSQGGIGTGSSTVSLANDNLLSATSAATALTDVNNAIAQVAAVRGAEGAAVNRLTAASAILSNQVQNLTSAENGIVAADIGQTVTNLSQYNILSQTGMAALAQANSAQQNVLTLLK